MKALFESLTIGLDGEKIRFQGEAEIDLQDAYKLQRFLTEQIQDLEKIQRNKLPFWKRVWA